MQDHQYVILIELKTKEFFICLIPLVLSTLNATVAMEFHLLHGCPNFVQNQGSYNNGIATKLSLSPPCPSFLIIA